MTELSRTDESDGAVSSSAIAEAFEGELSLAAHRLLEAAQRPLSDVGTLAEIERQHGHLGKLLDTLKHARAAGVA
ncbi:MAG TPA: hypothetical protein VGM87_22520 [Roseomonas sp.]